MKKNTGPAGRIHTKNGLESNLKSKWILLVLPLALLSCKAVHTEITIPAEPETIWAVLADTSGYKAWNPVLVPIEGDFREGAKIKYQMVQPDGKKSEVMARIKKLTKPRELNQAGGIFGILTFDHKWLLEPVDGGTRVTQHEEYRGIWVWFWDASWVEPTYRKANEALKERVIDLQNK